MNKRIFIQKKSQFDIHSQKVTKELQNLVSGISCKVFVIYDLFDITEEQLHKSLYEVFADPVTDIVYQSLDELTSIFHLPSSIFGTEPLPGQYDQRADSADQCLQLLGFREPEVKSGYLYVFEGISDTDLDKVKKYLINPIESREKNLNELILNESTKIKPVPTIENFIQFDANQLEELHKEFGFSMGIDDLEFIQKHFQSIQRNPTETELKVLDTYWSDHCRHTTFETEITEIKFENQFKETIQNTFDY